MKNVIKILILVIAFSFFHFEGKAQTQATDTSYLTTTHVLTAQGMILTNAITNRISYIEDGDQVIEENVISDSSYPDTDGSTHVSKTIESFTSVNGQVIFYKGEFIEADSTMIIQAEKDGNDFIIRGKSEGEMDLYEWDRQKIDNIDFFVFAIDYEKQKFTKKTKVRKIYDMYSLVLRDNKMSHLGNETITLAGNTFECSIIKFDYGVIKGKMWFTKLDNGNYILIKEEAESTEYGPFSMNLTDFSIKNPNKKKKATEDFGF